MWKRVNLKEFAREQAENRIVGFLTEHPDEGFTARQIASGVGLSKGWYLWSLLDDLLRDGVIYRHRRQYNRSQHCYIYAIMPAESECEDVLCRQ